MIPKKVIDLHPFEYEHSFDAKALNALQHTPGLDILIRQFNKLAIEKIITIQYTGSNLHVNKINYPKIYGLLESACDTLNLPAIPDLYLTWSYNINGFTVGVDNPIIVLTSGAIDLLSDWELQYLIGHEVGHIKSRHTLYHQVGQFLPLIADIVGNATLGVGKLISTPLQLALLQWSRMSEFTADRAGLLACQDLNTAASVMIKWAGMPVKYHGDIALDSFKNQAERFKQLDYENLNKIIKFISILDQTHPWTVMRTAELINWVNSGEYSAILNRDTKYRLNAYEKDGKRFCRRCKSLLEGSEVFCGSCGNKINGSD
jgi:Zn-dependent protease with chaperone function